MSAEANRDVDQWKRNKDYLLSLKKLFNISTRPVPVLSVCLIQCIHHEEEGDIANFINQGQTLH